MLTERNYTSVKKIFLSLLLLALVSGCTACGHDASGETLAQVDQAESGGSNGAGEEESAQISENHEEDQEADANETVTGQPAQGAENGEEDGNGDSSATETEAVSETAEPETSWQWQHDLPENHGLGTSALE